MSQDFNAATRALKAARDFLVDHRLDHDAACRGFEWPRFQNFNFARDWFDVVAEKADREALRIVGMAGTQSWTYGELSRASKRTANFLHGLGVRRGDAVLVMLGADVALWEVMLACIRLGAIIIPATTLLSGEDLVDRLERSHVKFVVTSQSCAARFPPADGAWQGIVVGEAVAGWSSYEAARSACADFDLEHASSADDPLLLYFTSGTTAKPKMVVHSHVSYPVGHLSTLFWIGLKPGDVHLNISSPGWAKHAWSSVFAPWLAEATIVALNHDRFDARATLDAIVDQKVTTFCAPPTVWRMLIQQDMGAWQTCLRELVSAGEPLNGEVISHVRDAWGLTIRDGFGQTETTALIGNSPGLALKVGSVGKPLPGYSVQVGTLGPTDEGEGEISVARAGHDPVGLMRGYAGHEADRAAAHQTGDIACQDGDGYITFVGRGDDVFKSSDYRISPFELESALIEHPAVAEAAVVPSPDPLRLSVPKAFLGLAPGYVADAALARSIFEHCRAQLAPYKRIRRLEVLELPKTISGKIRRVELRNLEADRRMRDERGALEWVEGDFADLGGRPSSSG